MTNKTIDLEEYLKRGEELPDIAAIGGERWFPKDTNSIEDMVDYWGGDFGCSSEYNKLRAVIMHRPGKEVENVDFQKVRFRAAVDAELFRKQHDDLANYYRSKGIKVYYIENGRVDRPNAVFCRDKIFMTPEGAIVTRLAMEERRGEERFMAETLAKIGVPIVRTITGNGIFEGANAMWVDRKTCILSTGVRANREGYEQVAYELRRQGVENIVHMQIPYGHAHVDGLLNLPSPDVAVAHVSQVPYDVLDMLKRKGYQIIEVPSMTEAKYAYSVNFVATEPGKVVTTTGGPQTVELLEKAGIEVDILDLTELNKGRGSVHCMTGFLKRDED